MKFSRCFFMFIVVLSLNFSNLFSPGVVSAKELPIETFYDCPTFEALSTAIQSDHYVTFNISSACTIHFEEDIMISSYAVLNNVGDGKIVFHGNADDSDEDDDTHFFTIVSGGSLQLENISLMYGKNVQGGAINIRDGYLVLDQVTLKKNAATGHGGAIYMSGGDVEIRNSTLTQNSTVADNPMSSSGSGGAIYASTFSIGSRLFIQNSTFSYNQTGNTTGADSGNGGAIYAYDAQSTMYVNVFNSTFYGNSTGISSWDDVGHGGAIFANNYYGSMALNIYNSTFSNNRVGATDSGNPGKGSSIFLRESSMNIAGSILANGYSSYGDVGDDCAIRGSVSIQDGGYNIIEHMGECEEYFSRSEQIDPGLQSSLMNNGGDTNTLALITNSNAVDQIPVGTSAFGINICGYDYANEDQRGELRPGGNNCDIGAYEIVDANHPYTLPATGFPKNQITQLSKPLIQYQILDTSTEAGMQLVIPSLGINNEIVGVPQNGLGWDVNWLGDHIGYLNGTSFPTWKGNTVLTGHSTNTLGQDGVFANLSSLRFGDIVIVHAWGQDYVYQVVDHYQTTEKDQRVLASSDDNLLTLITCTGYDEDSMTYSWRDVVIALLVEVR